MFVGIIIVVEVVVSDHVTLKLGVGVVVVVVSRTIPSSKVSLEV